MSLDGPPDLILTNARVLTMDRRPSRADAVAVKDGRVSWVGPRSRLTAWRQPKAKSLDCGGGLLLPGFHDAHIHLLSYASTASAVDCRTASVSSIQDIKREIGERASRARQGEWIRAWGYDETSLEDRRHPTRRDLDDATQGHPVRLDHRSGHACVLNSRALERVGIGLSFSEPAGATVGRELDSGEPSGLLFEMEDYLDGKIPPASREETEASIRSACANLLSRGVTSVQDATHVNSVARWDLLDGLDASSDPIPRLTMMPGYGHLSEFIGRGLGFGAYGRRLRLGHVKIMVTGSSGRMTPGSGELSRMIAECVEAGFPVAVHAVEEQVVESVAEALSAVSRTRRLGAPHRIEHASECPPDALRSVARSSAMVVTQPGFIHQNGDRYMATVDEGMLPYLYRVGSLAERGVDVAFGSDAPVGDMNPMLGVRAAVERRTGSGETLGEKERIGALDALEAYTAGSARAAGLGDEVGRIRRGMLADMVLFGEDVASVEVGRLADLRPVMTMLGGRVVWEA